MNMKPVAMLLVTVGLVTGMSADAAAQGRFGEVLDQINLRNTTLSGCVRTDSAGALYLVLPNGGPARLRGAKVDLEKQIGRPALVRGTTLLKMLMVQRVMPIQGTCLEPSADAAPTGSTQPPSRNRQVPPDMLAPPSGVQMPASGLPGQMSTSTTAPAPAGVHGDSGRYGPSRAR